MGNFYWPPFLLRWIWKEIAIVTDWRTSLACDRYALSQRVRRAGTPPRALTPLSHAVRTQREDERG